MNLGIAILEYQEAVKKEKIHWWDNLVIQYIQELCWLAVPRPDQLKQPQIITLQFAELNWIMITFLWTVQCTIPKLIMQFTPFIRIALATMHRAGDHPLTLNWAGHFFPKCLLSYYFCIPSSPGNYNFLSGLHFSFWFGFLIHKLRPYVSLRAHSCMCVRARVCAWIQLQELSTFPLTSEEWAITPCGAQTDTHGTSRNADRLHASGPGQPRKITLWVKWVSLQSRSRYALRQVCPFIALLIP